MGEGALWTIAEDLRLLGTVVGVEARAVAAVDSRFLSVSLFSRCSRSRGGGLDLALLTMSGLSGDDMAGACACSGGAMCAGMADGGGRGRGIVAGTDAGGASSEAAGCASAIGVSIMAVLPTLMMVIYDGDVDDADDDNDGDDADDDDDDYDNGRQTHSCYLPYSYMQSNG